MKVSLSWLKEYVSINLDTNHLADALTMAGLEVVITSYSIHYTKLYEPKVKGKRWLSTNQVHAGPLSWRSNHKRSFPWIGRCDYTSTFL